MALPKLNVSPSYKMTIPSSGKEVSFRPYLVKEEKVLMIAFESKDQKEALRAVVNTLQACIEDTIDVNALKTFDIEYMFTQVRSKSVGETSNIGIKCAECSTTHETTIDISSVKVEMPDTTNIIELTPSVSIEIDYPSYKDVMNTNLNLDEIEIGFAMAANSIKAILTEEERIESKDVSKEELREFIESMNQEQFKKLSDFLEITPTMKEEVKFTCKSCGHENEITLRGIQDFLS